MTNNFLGSEYFLKEKGEWLKACVQEGKISGEKKRKKLDSAIRCIQSDYVNVNKLYKMKSNGDIVIDFELKKASGSIRTKVLEVYEGRPEMMGVTVEYKWESCIEKILN